MRKVIQKVVRTYSKGYTNPTANLENLLAQGYVLVMVSQIGDCLEYIVQKEVQE